MSKLYVIHVVGEDRYSEYEDLNGTAICAFTDRKAADSFCKSNWREHCADLCPFDYVDEEEKLDAATSFEPEVLHDWFLDHGVKPPSLKDIKKWDNWEWAEWWQRHVSKKPLELRQKLWEAFDKVEFFNVVEIELQNG